MSSLRRFLDFYLNSSIHVALSVFSLSCITLLEFQIPLDKTVLLFNFFASITGYNFVKYFGLAKFHHRSLARWLKIIQIFSFLCFILMCYFALKLEEMTLLYLMGLGLITFLYAIPLLPKKYLFDHQQNLRSISGLKVYIIALTWSGVTVILPLVNQHIDFNPDVLIVTVQRFVLVLALMLPFEIRDLNYDSLKLATIPQQIGIRNTKIMGIVLVLAFFVLTFLKSKTTHEQWIPEILICILLLISILNSKKNQAEYYASFWVEGIPILWLGLMLIF